MHSWQKLFGILVLDIVVTTLIFFLVVVCFLMVFETFANDGPLDPASELIAKIPAYWNPVLWIIPGEASESGGTIVIYFYSTFLTSVWLWLFALSQFMLRVAARTGPVLRVAKYVLPIEERPFRSIGIVAGLIAMLGYFALAIFLIDRAERNLSLGDEGLNW